MVFVFFILSKCSDTELSFIPKALDAHSHRMHVYTASALITHKPNRSSDVLWLIRKWCQYESLIHASPWYFRIFGAFISMV